MAKIIIKDSEISSSAGIHVPGNFSISGSLMISDIFADAITVSTKVLINEDLEVLNKDRKSTRLNSSH